MASRWSEAGVLGAPALFAALAAVVFGGVPLVVADSMPEPLVREPGDAARGRAIVVDRSVGLCLLCHSGPFPEERFQGSLGPSLAGVGARLSPGQIRLRLVDPARVNPGTVMPAYFRTEGLRQVAPEHRDRPVLEAQQIEDVVAFLAGLKD